MISQYRTNKKYRPEIDGLRAFAILAVILNHFNKELIPNGYLGVDIFFVISGYVITSSISGKNYISLRNFLGEFYSKRLKRITPALTFYLVIIVVGISMFCAHPSIYLKTALSASFGLSNIYLYQNSTDYFATSTELNPFTQTWSLGIEEQFYFIYPILAWVSGFSRNKKNGSAYFFRLLIILGTISLISFIYLYSFDQPGAYFLITSRFWEIASGCLLFLGCEKDHKFNNSLKKLPPFLIFTSMAILMFIPSINSAISNIVMVSLTLILILVIKRKDNLFKLLTKKWIVFIGLISYSLYLWHWGILSLFKWTIGISSYNVFPILFLIFLISLISYNFIESPLRGFLIKKELAIILGIILMFFSSILSYLLGRPFLGKLFLGKSQVEINKSKDTKYCSKDVNKFGDLIIVGDSHALKLYEEMKECISTNQLNLASVQRTAFPRVNYSNSYLISKKENDENNILLKENFFKKYNLSKSESRKRNIIIANRNPLYFYPLKSSDSLLLPNIFWNDDYSKMIQQNDVITSWLKKLILFANDNANDNILVLLPPPEINTNNNPVGLCQKEWFRKNIPSFCFEGISIEESILSRKYFYQKLKNNVEQIDNLEIFDSFEDFCEVELKKCKVQNDGKLLYIDSNHLSKDGYSLILGRLFEKLK